MITPGFVTFCLMAIGAIVVLWLGYCAKTTATDDKHFGKFNVAFTVVLICYVLLLSRMPYVSIVTDTFVEAMNFVSTSIAEKFNKQHGQVQSTSTSTASASAIPAQSPTDYVEWASNTRIQPKAGVSLPHGWRVSFTDGAGTLGLVDKPIDVGTNPISVYWDPNNLVFPGQVSSPPVVLPNRP